MDTLLSDIERLKVELVAAQRAQQDAQRLNQESARRADNVRALVQLIASSAKETGEPLRRDVVDAANQYGISHIISGIPVEKPTESIENKEQLAERPEEEFFASTWIITQVLKSGDAGISPPQIIQLAKIAGIKMHHNYPYIVLRKAVEKGTVIKQGSLYMKKP
jgi:hypothetical protein